MEDRERALVEKLGKPPVFMGLIHYFPNALEKVAEVSAFGSQKHEFPMIERGFMGQDYTQQMYLDAAGRHLFAIPKEGMINHGDGGLFHASQATWDLLAFMEKYLIEGPEEEGRYDN